MKEEEAGPHTVEHEVSAEIGATLLEYRNYPGDVVLIPFKGDLF